MNSIITANYIFRSLIYLINVTCEFVGNGEY